MGNVARVALVLSLQLGVAGAAFGADLEAVRKEINSIERELLHSKESQATAVGQLKKIRRLLSLQQKEIQLSKKRIEDLGTSMKELSAQKQALFAKISAQKLELKRKLRELNRMTESEVLDASFIQNLDADNQKTYFLSKTLKKDLTAVDELKRNANEAIALELRIQEERNKLDYYVHELGSESNMLSLNEGVQREILRTNRASRLEALRTLRSLKDSERELEEMIEGFKPETDRPKAAVAIERKTAPDISLQSALLKGGLDLSFASLRGKLPYPAEGPVLSSFGKSYNPRTKLLTFQKGITIGAMPSSKVAAVSNGKVVFAGPLKNYGLIAIVEHPGQFYSLYGQLGAISVQSGAGLKQGELVGTTAAEPLYFEIRNKNVAINPLQWLLNNSITLTKQ